MAEEQLLLTSADCCSTGMQIHYDLITSFFQNLEFSLWPQAVSSDSLAGFQQGGRLPPCSMEPFGFLIYVHHSEWSKPKALLIKDESEVTFEVV